MKAKIASLLCGVLIAVVMIVMHVQADEPQPKRDTPLHEILLASPDGRFQVVMYARDTGAGLSVRDKTEGHRINIVLGPGPHSRFIAVHEKEQIPRFPLTKDGVIDQREAAEKDTH